MLGENKENPGHAAGVRQKSRSKLDGNRREMSAANPAMTGSSENHAPSESESKVVGSQHNNDSLGGNGGDTDRPMTVIVEGNIGCGKSTLLKYFEDKENVEIFPEPVHKWRDLRGENMLDLFYKDSSRWGCAFESYNQFTLLQEHQAKSSCRVKLMERSLYSGKYCFMESLFDSKNMLVPEYNVLTEWFDWLITTKDVHVDHIVYLRSTPEQCEKRILQRSRKEEAGIPLAYLTDLHERHEDWLIRKKFKVPAPVLILDASKPLDEMIHQFHELEEKLGFHKS